MSSNRVSVGLEPTGPAYGVIGASADPNVTFDWDFFPFMDKLQEAVGGTLAVLLVIDVAVLAIAGIVWGIGKIAGSRGMQQASGIGIVIAIGVAAVIGAASAMVHWGAGVDLGF